MLDVGPETQNRATQTVAAVDPCAAQHDLPFVLDMGQQPLVELVDIPGRQQIAERDDRKVRRPAGVKALDLAQARMEIAGECELFRLRGAECGNAGHLQGQP
jgi:hypothetical protein